MGNRIRTLAKRAQRALAAERYMEAERCANEILKIDPQNHEGTLLLASARMHLGKATTAAAGMDDDTITAAMDSAGTVIDLDDLFKSGGSGMADFLESMSLQLDAHDLHMKGKNKKALRRVDSVLAADPNSHTALDLKSMILLDMERYEETIEYSNRAMLAGSNSGLAHAIKGNALYKLGHIEEAILVLKQAIRFKHDDTDSLTLLCMATLELERYDDAAGYARRLLKLDPDNYYGLVAWGYRLAEQGRHAESIKCLDRILKLYPDGIEAAKLMQDIKQRQGRQSTL